MAKNFFKRYVWLIDTIYRNGYIPFEDLSRKWAHSSVNEAGEGYLPERTFFNHIEAIRDMFGIEIKCDRARGYYIANSDDLEEDGIRSWLMQSMSLNNMLSECSDLRDRILVEQVPSSHKWLALFVDAMRDSKAVEITYQSFSRDEPVTFVIHPYCLKLFRQRWYVVAKSMGTGDIRIYCLDSRMKEAVLTDEKFRVPARFNAEKYFANLFGVISVNDVKPQEVKIRVDAGQARYFESLPLHDSQRKVEAESDENYTVFKYHLIPTLDFKQELFKYGRSVEVLAPEWFREEIMDDIAEMASSYMMPVTNDDGLPYIAEEDEWKYM